MPRGLDVSTVGDYNQAVVLGLIRRHSGGISRVEIARVSGLSVQTISNATRRLIGEGLVREGERQIRGRGKPRVLLELNASSRYAVGIHIDPTTLTCLLLDLNGEVVARRQSGTPPEPEIAVAAMAREVDALLASSRVDADKVIGIGVAAPGPLDASTGTLIDPPLLEHWRDVPICDALARATGLMVVLEKDVIATAVAEVWTAADSRRENFATIYYGSGIGAGLVIGGELVRGASGNAGEIGHLLVQTDGPLCRCERRGCAGEVLTPHHLVQRAIDSHILIAADVDKFDYASIDQHFTTLVGMRSTDGPARIFDETVAGFTRLVVSIVNLLDLDRVVFAGPFWDRIAPLVLDRIRVSVARDPALVPPHDVIVESSSLEVDAAAIGAGCVVLDRVLTPHPAGLLISG
ncbi:ROK family protein [Microbacterium sp. NPDC091313]